MRRSDSKAVSLSWYVAVAAVSLLAGTVAHGQEDHDGDGVADADDNCPTTANPGQDNGDADIFGDACDRDRFEEGDLYLLASAFPRAHPVPEDPGQAIAWVDGVTGTSRVFSRLSTGLLARHMSHDPFRDCLIVKSNNAAPDFILVDAHGDETLLAHGWPHDIALWAPTGDGRIYMIGRGETEGRPFGYLDEADQSHDLIVESGEALLRLPLLGVGANAEMIYDPGTNSLFVFDAANMGIDVYKIPLTADGSRVAYPPESYAVDQPAFYDAYPFSFDLPYGVSAGPGGEIFVKIDVNNSTPGALMFTVDPVTLAFTDYATVGVDVGASTVGTYNSVRGAAFTLDDTAPATIRRFLRDDPLPGGEILTTIDPGSGGVAGQQLVSIGDTINRSYRLTVRLDEVAGGGEIYGIAGETVRLHGTVYLDPSHTGVTGWDLSLRGEGPGVVFGLQDCDESCASRLVFVRGTDQVASNDPAVVDSAVVPDDGPLAGAPQGPGIVDRVALRESVELGLSRVKVLRFHIDVGVPSVDALDGEEVRLFLGDGLQATGAPRFNTVRAGERTFTAGDSVDLAEFRFIVRAAVPVALTGDVTDIALTLNQQNAGCVFPRELRRQVFLLEPPSSSRSLVLELDDLDDADFNALYFRQGRSFNLGRFELAADDRLRPDQRLAVSSIRDKPVFVMAQTTVFDDCANELNLRIEIRDLALESFSAPSSARSAAGLIHASIVGAGFEGGTAFELVEEGGLVISPVETRVFSSRRADAIFDVTTAPEAVYTLRARNPDGADADLAAAFELEAGDVGPVIEAWLTGAGAYRYDRVSRITLHYRNVGDAEAVAPLFKVTGPENTILRLDRESFFHDDEMLVLGLHPGGFPGRIPPGGEGSIPIIFSAQLCAPCPADDPECAAETACSSSFHLDVLTARDADYVGWNLLPVPEGMTEEEWAKVWPALSRNLGGAWPEVIENLADIATRLTRRGAQAASVRELFRFAVREALKRPSAAVVGRVRDATSGAPLPGRRVLALTGDTVVSNAVTDDAGEFAIEHLENRETYRLEIVGYEAVDAPTPATVLLPAEGDVFLFELTAQPGSNELVPDCANCDDSGLPAQALFPPDPLFSPLASFALRIVNSWDPNDKEGPGDLGGDVPPEEIFQYTIYFENEAGKATGAAQDVFIIDFLDRDKFDLDTFEFLELRLGNRQIEIQPVGERGSELASAYSSSPPRNRFSGEQPFVATVEQEIDGESLVERIPVDFSWDLDDFTGKLEWFLLSNADEAESGLLPINDDSGRGEGSVTFRVRSLSLDDGEEITNRATIKFDTNPVVRTPFWRNRVSRTPLPPSNPLPRDHAVGVDLAETLEWRAPIASEFDLYLWPAAAGDTRPDMPPTVPSTATRFTPLRPHIEAGGDYRWQVVAHNDGKDAEGPVWRFEVESDACDAVVASQPSPASGQENVDAVGALLGWQAAPGALAYDVFLWATDTEPPNRILVPAFHGTELLVSSVTAPLEPATNYSWQIVALFGGDCKASEGVWTFRTLTPFTRGDSNGDGALETADVVALLSFLFLDGFAPDCLDALDVTDDGGLDIADPLALLFELYLGGFEIPPPVVCAGDPTEDGLGCESHAGCP